MVPARYRNNPFTPMNSLLEEFFGDMIPERTTQAGFRPPLDLREDEGHFYAQLELPGMSKEEVKISIEDSGLTVRGDKKKQELLENHFPTDYSGGMLGSEWLVWLDLGGSGLI